MRTVVAEIVADTLERLPLQWTDVRTEERREMKRLRKKLEDGEL